MFIVVSILDDVPVLPKNLGSDYKLELKRQIQAKYVDRVIANVGLCVEFYEFTSINEFATIYPGDGMASYNESYFKAKNFGEPYFKVEFKLIVFQPSVDEWLVGSIVGSDECGMTVSLGFYQDVFIPCSNLCLQNCPFAFDPESRCHVWLWKNKEAPSEKHIPFFCDKEAVIRFRVVAVDFKEPTHPKDNSSTPDGLREPLSDGHSDACMRVIGAVDRDGLGCVSWWPGNIFENESSEAPLMDGSLAEGTSDDVVMEKVPIES